MPKPLRINKKRVAYSTTTEDGESWGIGIVTEGESGYRPVADYGPYDEKRAEGVAERLNLRINVDKATAHKIIASSMVGAAIRR
jgi:hypothetical protein